MPLDDVAAYKAFVRQMQRAAKGGGERREAGAPVWEV